MENEQPKKATIISFGLQKGGVGKSSTTSMIATIAARDKKVLVIDGDSQGNVTFILTRKSPYDFTDKTILEGIAYGDVAPYIYEISDNLHIVPAEDRLSDLEDYVYVDWRDENKGLYEKFMHLYMLQTALKSVIYKYDYIFIDLPPNPGLMTRMGLVASDYALVIMSCDVLAYEAVSRYLAILQGTKRRFSSKLILLGIIPTLIDGRAGIDTGFLDKAKAEYGDWIFESEIRRNVKIKEFAALGISDRYADERKATAQYESIYKEIVERVSKFEELKTQ